MVCSACSINEVVRWPRPAQEKLCGIAQVDTPKCHAEKSYGISRHKEVEGEQAASCSGTKFRLGTYKEFRKKAMDFLCDNFLLCGCPVVLRIAVPLRGQVSCARQFDSWHPAFGAFEKNANPHLHPTLQFSERCLILLAAFLKEPDNVGFLFKYGSIPQGDDRTLAVKGFDDLFVSQDTGEVRS